MLVMIIILLLPAAIYLGVVIGGTFGLFKTNVKSIIKSFVSTK